MTMDEQVQSSVPSEFNPTMKLSAEQIEMLKAQAMLGFKTDDKEFKEKIEVFKENRKDERVTKQAIEQSKLIEQRKQSNII